MASIYSPLKVVQLARREAPFILHLLPTINIMAYPFRLEMGPNIWAIYNKKYENLCIGVHLPTLPV